VTAVLEDLFATRIATAVPAVLAPALAADLRARLARLGYTRYALVDRGSYDYLDAPIEPAVALALEALAALATRLTSRPLVLAPAATRALRLRPGDYLLAHHDRAHPHVDGAPLVEVTLDLSAAPVPGAVIDYRRDGAVVFRFASTPCAAAIVERGPTTTASHAYLSRRLAADIEVVRLVARLRKRA
jgi:hypothetical protein